MAELILDDFKRAIGSVIELEPKDLNQNTAEDKLFDSQLSKQQLKNLMQSQHNKKTINKLKIENESLKNLSSHRIKYSWAVLGFVFVFVIAIFATIFLNGFGQLSINDNVLITLITTGMTKVVGILYIIAKWLYPQK